MILVIGSEKGGTGKTTLATHLAYMRILSGRRAILVDCDQQLSASTFISARDMLELQPRIPCVQISANREQKTAMESAIVKRISADILGLGQAYEDVIVDVGGQDSVELRAALVAADKFYHPIGSSKYDLWSSLKIEDYLQKIGAEEITARFVLNKLPALDTVAAAEIRRFRGWMEAHEFKVLGLSEHGLAQRNYFSITVGYGTTVFEDLPGENKLTDTKACRELLALYCEIYEESADDWRARVRAELGLSQEAAE